MLIPPSFLVTSPCLLLVPLVETKGTETHARQCSKPRMLLAGVLKIEWAPWPGSKAKRRRPDVERISKADDDVSLKKLELA